MHPDVGELAFLLGTWRGEGRGAYPTIEDFRYGEELTFDHVGDAFLGYSQQSWLLDDGTVLHAERGFIRPGRDGAYELTLAHPLGLTEVAHGRLAGSSLTFDTGEGDVRRTATGMHVVALSRRYECDGATLRYALDMTTDETPHTRHLDAELHRVVAAAR
ncbi:MAG TPA: FABP family protein [Actinomycetota bacterium]|nr:FABP family protein [Actinomycetota bacterium]